MAKIIRKTQTTKNQIRFFAARSLGNQPFHAKTRANDRFWHVRIHQKHSKIQTRITGSLFEFLQTI